MSTITDQPHRKHRYPCLFCKKGYEYPSLLRNHIQKVHCPKNAGGDPSPSYIKRKQPLDNDMNDANTAVSRETFECVYEGCSYSTDHIRALDFHVQSHHDAGQPIKLHKLLGKGGKELKGWETFIRGGTGSNRGRKLLRMPTSDFTCRECNKLFFSKWSLRNHERVYHSSDPMRKNKCSFAGCTFSSAHKIRVLGHEARMHTRDFPYKCTYADCDFGTFYKVHMTIHIRRHTGEKPYKCLHEGCDYASVTAQELKCHQRTHDKTKSHKCSFDGCTFECSLPSTLTMHMRRHMAPAPFKCHFADCSYECHFPAALRLHMKKHDKISYQCPEDYCTYSTSSAHSLERHRISHAVETGSHCYHEGCSYVATSGSDLKDHLLSHLTGKLNVCPHDGCGFVAVKLLTLQQHIIAFLENTPFKCHAEGCNFSACTLVDFKNHVLIHTEAMERSLIDAGLDPRRYRMSSEESVNEYLLNGKVVVSDPFASTLESIVVLERMVTNPGRVYVEQMTLEEQIERVEFAGLPINDKKLFESSSYN